MNKGSLRAAELHLSNVDPVMRRTVADCGPCRLDRYQRRQPFAALIQTIIAQQISTSAAASIHRRFLALFKARLPSARALLAVDDDALRTVGLSRQKIVYLRDLASRVRARQLSWTVLEAAGDDEVIERLVEIKGIGEWTAQVFMIFTLGRLDVLPVADLGLLDGVRVLYELAERPKAEGLTRIAEPWRPYRSVGCWYLWQGRRRARGERLR